MATIALTVTLTNGQQTQAGVTVADVDIARAATALATYFPGQTNQQIINTGLHRLLAQVVALTQNYEERQVAVKPLPVT